MKQIIICCIVTISFNSCIVGQGDFDWSIKLTNGYEISHASSKDIIIGFSDGNGISYKEGVKEGELAIIPAKIIKYSLYNQYICAVINLYLHGEINDTDEYYILNTIEKIIAGPMTENEYNIQIQNFEIIITEWIETKDINIQWLKKNGYVRINPEYNEWRKL